MFRLLVMLKIDRKSHIKIFIFKGSEVVMNDLRRQTYQLLPLNTIFSPYVDNSCKLFKHSANLGQTLLPFFTKASRSKKAIGWPDFC